MRESAGNTTVSPPCPRINTRQAESCAACITDRRIHLANCLGIDTQEDASSKDQFEKILFNVTSLQHCPPGDAINRTNKVLFQKIRFDGSILRLHQAIHMLLPEDLRQSPNPLGSGRVTDIWIRVIHRARFLGISPALSCPAITRARSGVHHGFDAGSRPPEPLTS
jgi:hypothetical protein